MSRHICIIGNGVAGVTAARHIRKRGNDRITIISGETSHFFSRTALMYIYMGHMTYEHTKPYEDWFWKKNRLELIMDWVMHVDFIQEKILLKSGSQIHYDVLVIATGSKPITLNWKGKDLEQVQCFYSLQDLRLMERNTRDAHRSVVVGGGLIGIEMAEMLLSRKIAVSFLVREENFFGMIMPAVQCRILENHMREHGVELYLETELARIEGEKRAEMVVTNRDDHIPCDFVGIGIGVAPNVELFYASGLEMQRGILVDEYLNTNFENVYAVGDCAQLRQHEHGRKPIEAVWYVGRAMGEAVAKTITGQPTKYDPGIWFNSAKFFDIEYQVYGTVSPHPKEGEERHFHWEAGDGRMSLLFSFAEKDKGLLGMSALGVRLRHEVIDGWISQGSTVHYALEHLRECNFDPEFFRKWEWEVVAAFNAEFGENLMVQKKSWANILRHSFRSRQPAEHSGSREGLS